MGNSGSGFKKISFENVIDYQKNTASDKNINAQTSHIMINTLPQNEQMCLIEKTISSENEESVINNALYYNKNVNIIVYGKNNNDMSVFKKTKQLTDLGFSNVFIYLGGLFEWLLLQEVYGADNFKTQGSELDILKYRPTKYKHENKYGTNSAMLFLQSST